MNNWQKQKLGDIADVALSNVDKKTNENERVVRLCNYTDVYKNSFINANKAKNFMIATCNENEFEKFILRKGQVAITKDSETKDDIGVSTYISEDFDDVVLGYHLSLITPYEDRLNGRFLHYWLNSKQAKKYFENNAGGSGQRCTLPLDIIKSIPLNVPTLPTQEKIASILSNLDTKIELNNRINAELEAMAKTLYDYWFVQFDFPDAHGKPYKTSGGKMVFNGELKRKIPEGWEVKPLGKAINIIRGASPRPIDDYLSNQGMPWVKISDATKTDNRFIIATKQFIIEQGVASSRSVFPNTLILSNSASPAIPRIMKIDACVHDGWLVIDKYTGGLTPEFMYHYFEYERPRIITWGNGSIFKNLKTDYLKNFKFIQPPKSVLDKTTPQFKNISESIYFKTKENQQLAKLRDWLLPLLMNGQVRVR